ncbi:MAG TPA: hypothetical protein VFD48_05730 [Pyrinomonadaceae bacterium]|nr:hypothetical protein [Pyrinomonadaceae bacterium]
MVDLRQKFNTATRLFKTQGIRGIASEFVKKLLGNEKNIGNRVHSAKTALKGKLVELRGDVLKIDKCEFTINSPAISIEAKSYFMFGQYEKWSVMPSRNFLILRYRLSSLAQPSVSSRA